MKQKEKRGWSRKRLLGVMLLCLVPLGLAAILAGVGLWWQSSEIAAIRAEQEAVRESLSATGYPVTWEEWEARQPIFAEEDNGAPDIVAAIALLKAPPLEDDALLPYVARLEAPAAYESYTDESIRAMGAFVAANQPAIDAFLRGVGKPHVEYPAPEADEDEEEEDEQRVLFNGQISELRKTIRVATDYAISTGDDEQPWKLVGGQASAYKLYHDVNLSRIGTVPSLCDTIERMLNNRVPSSGEVTFLSKALEPLNPVPWYRASLVGDADPDTMIPEPRTYILLDPVKTFAAQSSLPDGTMERIAGRDYEAAKLRTLENVLEAYHLCEKPWSEAAPAIERAQEAEESLARGWSNETSPYHGMDSLFRTGAKLRLTRIALALERYRMNFGELPATLAALVEANPDLNVTDPFNGEPLHCVLKGDGYLLYSVGEDLTDDGGVMFKKRGEQERSGDIVFEVRR